MKTIEEIDRDRGTNFHSVQPVEQVESFAQPVKDVDDQGSDKNLRWIRRLKEPANGTPNHQQHPDHRVAWKALDQDGPNGVVTFHKLDEARTKVMVQMDYAPEGMKEAVGSAIGLDSHRVKDDLESFKDFIESRGSETGAWRGDVEN